MLASKDATMPAQPETPTVIATAPPVQTGNLLNPPHPDGPTCEPIPMPFAGWSWGKRAVWLAYIPPYPGPTIEGPPDFGFGDEDAA
jgi:hypothetical protein